MKYTKYLIIGAGITGLSFAKFVNDDCVVLEKEREIGGYCRSIYTSQFQWDYAGHFFHFRNDDMKSLFFELLKHETVVTKNKITKIFYKEKLIDYPFQNNIHQLESVDYERCLKDFEERIENINEKNFEEMLYSRFGKGITEMFLKPYNEKLYACSLNELDSYAMGRFFPSSNIKEHSFEVKVENKSYNSTFHYPKKGTATFINALADSLEDQCNLKLSEQVIAIDVEAKVVKTNKNLYAYDCLINTVPFNQLLSLIGEKESCDAFSSNKVLVLNLGFDKASIMDEIHWLYVADKKINFYRVGFYNHILDSEFLSLYLEISFKTSDVINVEKALNDALLHLKDMKIIDDHKLIEHSAVVMDPAYVHINSKSEKQKRTWTRFLESKDIYTLGRYGKWHYNSMEDNMVDAKHLASHLRKQWN